MIAYDSEKGHYHAYNHQMKHLGSVKHPGGPKGPSKGTSKSSASSGATSKGASKKLTSAPSRKLAKRDNTTSGAVCSPLSVDDVQKLPGWKAAVAAAQKSWGTGSYNLKTNDPDYPGTPLMACTQTDPAKITPDSKPSCSTQDQNADGPLQNGGTTSLTAQQGTEASAEVTVTQESAFSVGTTTSVGIEIPGLATASTDITMSTTLTNSLGKSNTATTSTMQSQTVTASSNPGQNCTLKLTSTACTLSGSGQIMITATGWVWFDFNDQTQGHYKWALNLDTTIPKVQDRSSPMGVKAVVKSTTKAHQSQTCK